MVGMTGFEPATFRSQSGRATNLRHIPWAHVPAGLPEGVETECRACRLPP